MLKSLYQIVLKFFSHNKKLLINSIISKNLGQILGKQLIKYLAGGTIEEWVVRWSINKLKYPILQMLTCLLPQKTAVIWFFCSNNCDVIFYFK